MKNQDRQFEHVALDTKRDSFENLQSVSRKNIVKLQL